VWLIAPFWPQQGWFPKLLPLFRASPLRLPPVPQLLSNPQGSPFDGMAHFRNSNQTTGLSSTALELISQSLRNSTKRSYASCWDRWLKWCSRKRVVSTDPSEHHRVNYLGSLFLEGLSSNTICLHKSAIVACLLLRDDKFKSLQDSVLIQRVLKGSFNSNPRPKKSITVWDVNILLQFFTFVGSR
jgi:hypothetical protein